MNKIKKISRIILLLSIVVGVSFASQVLATDAGAPEAAQPDIETIEGMYFTSNGQDLSKKHILGDVVCFGETCKITGEIEGDVLVAASTVEISANIHGDVRAAAQTLELAGAKISGSASLAGDSVRIDKTTEIGQDLSVLAREVNLLGGLGRDARLMAQTVYLDGQISRNAEIVSETLTVTAESKIGGDLSEESARTTITQSVIAGSYAHKDLRVDDKSVRNVTALTNWFLAINVAIVVIVLAVIRPAKTKQLAQREFKLADIFLITGGFGMLFVIPIVAALMILMGLSLLAGVLLIVIWLVMLMLSIPYALYYLIENAVSTLGVKNRWLALVVGLAIYGVLSSISIISWLINLALVLFGAGLLSKVALMRQVKTERLIEQEQDK